MDGGHLGLMHGRDLEQENSIENEFPMLITLEKVVHIFFRLKVKKLIFFKMSVAAILDLCVNETPKYKKCQK